jgi:hypothetical protein
MAHFHAGDGRWKNPSENGGKREEGRGTVPEWVRRLYGNAELHVPDARLAWNAVHIEQFLRWCRGLMEAEASLSLGDLCARYLKELRLTMESDYRREQVREAA